MGEDTDLVSGMDIYDIMNHFQEVYDFSIGVSAAYTHATSLVEDAVKKKHGINLKPVGSMHEGLTYKLSDADIMIELLSVDAGCLKPVCPGFVRVPVSVNTMSHMDYLVDNMEQIMCVKGDKAYYSPQLLYSYHMKLMIDVGDFTFCGLRQNISVSVPVHPISSSVSSDDFSSFIRGVNPSFDNISTIFNINDLQTQLFNAQSINTHTYDFVPCISCHGWPESANTWISRSRPSEWPDTTTITDIVKTGFHLVCKTPPDGDPDTDWRLSFSMAELKLANNMTCEQKATYCVFKYLIKEGISNPDIIPSYCLKTVYLWVLEQISASQWTTDQYAARMLNLLDQLITSFIQKRLPHYFIEDMNLLDGMDNEDLLEALKQVCQLRENPTLCSVDFFAKHKEFYNLCESALCAYLQDTNYPCEPILNVIEKFKDMNCSIQNRKDQIFSNIKIATSLLLKFPLSHAYLEVVMGKQMYDGLVASIEPFKEHITKRYEKYMQHTQAGTDMIATAEDLEEEKEFEKLVCRTLNCNYDEYVRRVELETDQKKIDE